MSVFNKKKKIIYTFERRASILALQSTSINAIAIEITKPIINMKKMPSYNLD